MSLFLTLISIVQSLFLGDILYQAGIVTTVWMYIHSCYTKILLRARCCAGYFVSYSQTTRDIDWVLG